MNKINRRPWFERKFTFDLPVWLFPNVLERLRGTPARLQDRLGLLPAEILTRRDGERWSMQEHAGHLQDLDSLDLARVEDYLQGKETLQAADVNNRKTYEAHHNSVSLKSILDAFRLERAEFVRRLGTFDEALVSRTAIHPRLKVPMRVIDFAFFVAEHDDHHLVSITELIEKFAPEAG